MVLSYSNLYAKTLNIDEKSSPVQSSAAQKEHVDAIEIILKDHEHIKKMLTELEKSLSSDISQSRSIYKELKSFIEKHETMEQELWYPELVKQVDLKEMIAKLKNEEETVIAELNNLEDITDDKQWISKVKKLIKDVTQHLKNEESNLFPKVKKKTDKSSLDQIADKFKAYKK